MNAQASVTAIPSDFAVERGDIIVCPSSNPSRVLVFAIAGSAGTVRLL